MPPRIVRARPSSANAPEDAEIGASAAGEETVTSSVAVPALTRQQALGPLLSRVVSDAELAVLSVDWCSDVCSSYIHANYCFSL